MVSAVDRAKRALVVLLRALAVSYGLVLKLSRESTDQELRTAYRRSPLEPLLQQGEHVPRAGESEKNS